MAGSVRLRPHAFFEVERIIGVSNGSGSMTTYQVQWAPTWVCGLSLVGCEHLIEEFLKQHSKDVLQNSHTSSNSYDIQIQNVIDSSKDFPGKQTDRTFTIHQSNLGDTSKEGNNREESSVIETNLLSTTGNHRNFPGEHSQVKQELLQIGYGDIVSQSSFELDVEGNSFYTSAEPNQRGENDTQGPDLVSISSSSTFGQCSSLVSDCTEMAQIKPEKFNSEVQDECERRELSNISFKRPQQKEYVSKISPKKKLKQSSSGEEYQENCRICGKEFFHKGNIKRHMVTSHNEDARYECGFCGKKFYHKVDRVRHVRKHTGEKPFECTVCGKRFTRKATLGKHMSLIHNCSQKDEFLVHQMKETHLMSNSPT